MERLKVFLVLLSLAASHSELTTEGGLVRLNRGIVVGRGQSVHVTNRDLQFNVPQNQDSCKVEVVLNEPASQQVGKLKPQVFDCHFFPEEVKYTHNGCPILEEDNVMLRIYRFTESETLMETLLLKVRVTEPEAGLIRFGTVALEVPEFYGISNPIDKEVVSFMYNTERSGTVCTVKILPLKAAVPAHGQMITDVPQYPSGRSLDGGVNSDQRTVRQTGLPCVGNKPCPAGVKEVRFLVADCEHFLKIGLKYQHLSPPSPDIDYIPITVEIRDKKRKFQLQVENAWIPVKIKGAIPNQRPKAAFMSMFILELDQFILTPLTTAALDANDDESPKHRLFFKITKPPEEGYITHLEDHTKPITSFIWQDLHEMKIAYQPPNISHTERRNYEVDFKAVDVFFLESAPIMVHFSIRTAETNAPRVSWNMGLDLLEGQSRSITWENLQIVDNDNINAVRLVTVEGLQHGRLTVRGGKRFLFTVQDIKDGTVRYHHDDTDTTKDYIVFKIFDGKHVARHKFPVNILPKDDSPPFLINNLALQLAEGEMLPIEDHMLLASDSDSSDDYILYRITRPPKAGEIVKKTGSDLPGLPVTSFLQQELIHGLIYYRHYGGEIFEDSVVFVLSDSQEPPNLSDPQTVMVHVTPVKDQLPKEVPGIMRSLVVKETEIGYITEDHLHFTDTESPENELMYIVTKPCFFPFNRRKYDAGKIFFTDSIKSTKKDPSVPMLKSFTQHAVRHMKVAYMPPQGDLGPAPLLVQFVFSVTDQQGGMVTGLVFNITIMPVDDQPPEIFTNQIKVEEGSGCLITQETLMVTDRDTQDEDLRIQLQRRPAYGEVQVQGNVMWEGDMFTLQDLRFFHVRYQHDDSETLSDSVVFTATDGFNTADGVLTVKIIPINDEPPELGLRLKSTLRCPEGEKVTITTEYLHATDMDSDDMKLTYMIARAPSYGAVERGGVTVDKFSQLDISRGLISYRHTGGEIGYSPCVDTVTVIISDGEAGTVDSCCYEGPLPPPVPLHGSLPIYDLNITVLPVNNQPPAVHVGEMFVVDEGRKASLAERYLHATDRDTRQEDLTFDLKSLPQFGYLENTLPSPGSEKSNAGINIVSFSLQHLKAGSINYVQSRHERMEPTGDHFLVSVGDGVQQSRAVPFYVIINPSNDEAPNLQVGNITVMEGDMCQLGPGTLSAVDLDSPPDHLEFSVVRPPVHGTLLNAIYGDEVVRYRQRSVDVLLHDALTVSSFSVEEIREGLRLVYMHDGTETLGDSLTVRLTDGEHVVWGTVYINITPINDEVPVVLKNAGLEVEVGENKVISSVALEAEDRDTPRQKLHYIINSVPKFGQLQLKTQWQWMVVYQGMNITQRDIDMNLVWYLHTTIVGSKGHDSFRFYVTDGDNSSPPQNFYISIKDMKKGDIVVLAKPVTLTEGDRVTLTTDVLLAADGSGRPDELLFAISVPPAHGQIQYINYPGLAVSSFSQLDVAAQKICYVHDNSHEGNQDSFRFIVSNGLTATNGSLRFVIEQTDRQPPELISNTGLQVTEGATMVISPNTLWLTDPDTSPANLTFTIIRAPQHGTLRLGGRALSLDRFTQLQVDNLDVSYQHNGQASELDSFAFVASDGTNRGFLVNGQLREEPVTFTIQVERTDKTSPRILINESPTIIDTLRDGRFGIYITTRNLKASDVDSDDKVLIFTVLRPPYFGYLENTNTGMYIRGTFTQSDIDKRRIRYIINPSIEVTSDSYEFKISDPTGNSIVPQVMELKWSRIEMAETLYRVCEDIGTLSIKVTRKGYSSDPSYISIKVREVSATFGRDFTHSSASLIQFDPGVSTKVWNVFIKNDGLEENNEKLEVRLSSPINAVLGQSDVSLVEIMDLRGGACDPIHLRTSEEDEIRGGFEGSPQSNFRSPDSRREVFRAEERVDTEWDLVWDSFPSPPRGDVPQTDQFCDFPQTLNRDRASPVAPRKQLQAIRDGRASRGIKSVRIEERSVPDNNWQWPLFPFPPSSRQELPQQDALFTLENAHSLESNNKQIHKAECPEGWTQNQKHCYLLNSWRNSTWEGGQTACKHMFYGNLVSVHSKKEMKWLSRFAQKQPIWIGLRAEAGSGRWAWTNGRPVTFTNWKKQKPGSMRGNVRSKCTLAQGNGKWVARPCSGHQGGGYICSISLA